MTDLMRDDDPASRPLHALSLSEAAQSVRNGTTTSAALTAASLRRIAELNPQVNAVVTVMAEQATAQAALLDREASAGAFRSPIHGVPILIKDNIDTAGTRTAAASAIYESRIPDADAEVCARLIRAGAVLVGKVNLDEFANGISSVTSAHGPVRNPWSLDRIAGGSSGGSGAAVAAGMAYGALGTDTGGSIRAPAAYCGLVGLKPTYGLVPTRGIIPVALSVDTCGPMARTAEDVALLLGELAGYDRLDPTSSRHEREDYRASLKASPSSLRVGVARMPFAEDLEDDIAEAFEQAVARIATLCAVSDDFRLPSTSDLPIFPFLAERHSVHRAFLRTSRERYMSATLKELEASEAALNGESGKSHADKLADFVDAHWQLARMRRTMDDAFEGCDVIILPTTRIGPGLIAKIEQELLDDPDAAMPMFVNSIAFNILGLPALSTPCGFDRNGMPIGLMIAGPPFSEGKILRLAHHYEKATGWVDRSPMR